MGDGYVSSPATRGGGDAQSPIGTLLGSAVPLGIGAAVSATPAAGAAAAGAGAAATVPFMAFAPPIAAVMIMISILMEPNAQDRRSEGFALQLDDNPTDPNAPIQAWYGMPVGTPPVLFRYFSSDTLNSLRAAESERLIVGLSLGYGPMDGREQRLWMNGTLLSSVVDSNASVAEKTLIDTGGGKKWRFPQKNVDETSVVVYVDGVVAGSWVGSGTGGAVTGPVDATATAKPVTVRQFTNTDDGTLPVNVTRYGGRFPTEGKVDPDTLTARVNLRNAQYVIVPRSDGTGTTRAWMASYKIQPDDLIVSTLDDGTQYFWYRLPARAYLNPAKIKGFTVTYTYRPTIKIEEDADGTSYAIFDADRSASTVTATYSTNALPTGVKLTYRPGTKNQDTLPLPDGVRNVFNVGTVLAQGSAVTYTTKNEVDDVVVGIASDADGFYESSIHGQDAGSTWNTHREIQIKFRQADAAAVDTGTLNPKLGWVPLMFPGGYASANGPEPSGPPTATGWITGSVEGGARWSFSVADLFARTKGTANGQTGNRLPTDKYIVEVVSTNAESTSSFDFKAHPERIYSEISFSTATEVRHINLTLPHHATLTVEVEDTRELKSEPLFTTQQAARKVWVPGATAVYDPITKRPEPGTLKWSRNPVWCACDLVTNEVFGGGKFFDWNHIDLTTALAAATYCDATVEGEPRAELDIAITNRSALLDHVAQILSGAQIMPVVSGGTWKFIIDQDASSVMSLTDDDFEHGEISAAYPGLEELPTEIEAAFTDEENGFELVPHNEPIPGIERDARILRRIDLTGTRRRSQVIRVTRQLAQQFEAQRMMVSSVMAGWRAMLLEAGDIVTVTNTTLGYTAKLFRVMLVGWGSNLKPVIALAEHVPAVYNLPYKGGDGGDTTLPGEPRPPPGHGKDKDKDKGRGKGHGHGRPSFAGMSAKRVTAGA